MSVLMIAEKPSLAQSLANILSNGSMSSRKGGPCPVWEYRGQFRNENVQFKFTSVCGHVFTTGFEPKYSDWDKTDPIELYDAKIVRIEANKKMQLVKFLKKEAKGCRYLVLWLDCDKEGENICFEILDIVKDTMNCSFKNPQTVFRAHFSAITAKDIKQAFQKLGVPNELEALSVTARQELDLIIGCSFTRYQTKFFHGKYGDLDTNLVSYGPCQVPTLGFCVTRHDEIENFVSKPYWLLSAVVVPVGSSSRQFIDLQWTGDREFKQERIKQLHNQIKGTREGFVESLKKAKKSLPRPKALNTVEMLKIASSRLGIGPHVAMQTAEKLYTQGYISYPRTETDQYPKNFNLRECLSIQEKSSVWGKSVSELLRDGIANPRSGTDHGDHPPITPMRSAEMHELGGDSWRMYEFIARHFISSLAPDMIKEVISMIINIGGQKFKATCSSIVDPGFTKFMHRSRSEEDEDNEEEQALIPINIKEGDKVMVSEIKTVEKRTQPPGYLTESELISLMEKHGIGTDASIPTHINNIVLRNYVQINAGRTVVPTKLGIFLVHGYRKIDPELVAPTSRREMEKELNQIAKGEKDFKIVLKSNIELFRKKFIFFMENIRGMDELFEANFTSLAETGKPFSRCGKCRRFMKLISSKPERLVCNTCDDVYPVPRGGTVKTYKEEQCPIDNFDLIYFTGSNRKYIFCPNCSANPPFEDMLIGSNCSSCTNENCKFSLYSNSLGPCTVCRDNGQLVLDQGSGPGSWKAYCTKCSFTMSLFKDATKVGFIADECDKCNKRLITLKYPAGKSKLESGSTDFKGCFHCSSEMASVVETIKKFSLNSAQRTVETGRSQFGGGQISEGGRGRGRGGKSARGNKTDRGGKTRGRGGKGSNTHPRERSFSPDYDGPRGRGRGRRGGRDNGPVYNRSHSPRIEVDWEALGLGGDSGPSTDAPRPRTPSPEPPAQSSRGSQNRGRGRGDFRGRGRGDRRQNDFQSDFPPRNLSPPSRYDDNGSYSRGNSGRGRGISGRGYQNNQNPQRQRSPSPTPGFSRGYDNYSRNVPMRNPSPPRCDEDINYGNNARGRGNMRRGYHNNPISHRHRSPSPSPPFSSRMRNQSPPPSDDFRQSRGQSNYSNSYFDRDQRSQQTHSNNFSHNRGSFRGDRYGDNSHRGSSTRFENQNRGQRDQYSNNQAHRSFNDDFRKDDNPPRYDRNFDHRGRGNDRGNHGRGNRFGPGDRGRNSHFGSGNRGRGYDRGHF